jgi:hypothetical protein
MHGVRLDAPNARKECPLIRVGLPGIVDENACAPITCLALQGKGDQVAETAPR